MASARVMGTLWPVEDRATADLMEHFYERFTSGADAAAALAAAQRALLKTPATAHPFYWAGFEVGAIHFDQVPGVGTNQPDAFDRGGAVSNREDGVRHTRQMHHQSRRFTC